METFDTFLTYTYDFVLGGGLLYIGTALVVHLVDRWNQLEVRPKVAAPAVKLPLALKATETQAITLNAQERRTLSPLESAGHDPQLALSLQPPVSQSVPLPEPELPSTSGSASSADVRADSDDPLPS
ncbi:MAG: hypothetical protein IGS50_23705 [Synechococcales cyanobacterium C42_A2020_086]|jgi:hypothetical protein|nr:hypothetical protein [Synechococcales cyanobacterium C42_A2020_086]